MIDFVISGKKVIIILLLIVTFFYMFFHVDIHNYFTSKDMMKFSNTEEISSRGELKTKLDFSKNVKIDEILELKTPTLNSKKTEMTKKQALLIWDKIKAKGFIPFDHELNELLQQLRLNGAGWFFYNDFIELISEKQIPDEVALELVKILIDAYEGESRDQSYHIVKNEKDKRIQELIRQQLLDPIGKNTFKKLLNFIYLLESEDKRKYFFEEVVALHPSMLSKEELLSYRFRYSYEKLDTFAELLNDVNLDSNNKTGSLSPIILKQVSKSVWGNHNGLLNHEAAQTALRTYLEKNKVNIEAFHEIPYVDISKEIEISSILDVNDEIKKVQEIELKKDALKQEYGLWLQAYGASMGESNPSDYLYQQALQASDPIEIIAIIDFQAAQIENSGSEDAFNKLIQDVAIKQKLEEALLNAGLSNTTREDLESTINNYFSEGSSGTINEDQNNVNLEKGRKQLENLLNDASLSDEERKEIQQLLLRY